jgi:hypothetical protein
MRSESMAMPPVEMPVDEDYHRGRLSSANAVML